jgi:hypothetical protein
MDPNEHRFNEVDAIEIFLSSTISRMGYVSYQSDENLKPFA